MPTYPPRPSQPPSSSPLDGHPSADAGGDVQERLIPFPVRARSTGEPEQQPRRRREMHDIERPSPARRSARRRRPGSASWLQRNALSIAAISVLVAVLGLAFGLLQIVNRPDPSVAVLAGAEPEQTAVIVGTTVAAPASVSTAVAPAATADVRRDITATARVIDANYTVVSGDTLNGIAQRFGTSADRIQAFNNLPDPRTLRIGTRLVIPPAL